MPKSSPTLDLLPVAQPGADICDFKYSVIIPVFNDAESVSHVIRRTAAVFERHNCRYEIIAVNDGSTDDTWDVISLEAAKNSNVIGIDLVKNYGQHPAMFCGLKHSTGDFVITIDADLQNPPEEMIKLMRCACLGQFDVIFGQFPQKKHSLFRRIGSRIVGKLNEKIFDKQKDLKITNYRLLSRNLVNRICKQRTSFPYLNGLALRCSKPNRRTNVMVQHEERHSGKSKYTPTRISGLMLTILFNYSSYPLAVVSMVGLVVAFCSFGIGAMVVIKKLMFQASVPGWTSLVLLISFFNGILTLMVGMLGEYVIRILKTVSDGAAYEVGEVCRFE